MRYHHCFVGVSLPDKLLNEFENLQKLLKAIEPTFKEVSDVFPHITLYFLGNQTKSRILKIGRTVESSVGTFSGIELSLLGAECFKFGVAKPVYLKVQENPAFESARKVLATQLATYNSRGYRNTSHATLGRLGKVASKDAVDEILGEFHRRYKEQRLSFKLEEICICGRRVGVKAARQEKLLSYAVS
jgi:2'-5' RNA ligase